MKILVLAGIISSILLSSIFVSPVLAGGSFTITNKVKGTQCWAQFTTYAGAVRLMEKETPLAAEGETKTASAVGAIGNYTIKCKFTDPAKAGITVSNPTSTLSFRSTTTNCKYSVDHVNESGVGGRGDCAEE